MTSKPSTTPFAPPQRVLMGPGPSDVAPQVLQAMAAPVIGHLDPAFLQLMDANQEMLRYWFGTKNQLTLPISATGSAGMETCLVNLLEPGDKFLACVNGVFGGRMADVARRIGAEVTVLEKPWGEVFTADEIAQALQAQRPKVVGIVHAETSTGVLQPMADIGPLIADAGALCVLDCVTSLAGVSVEIDKWRVAAAYSGTQKCLSCPPGLAPVTFSDQAKDVLTSRKTPVSSWYLDLNMICSYWGGERAYHHTAPISMNYALHEALRLATNEGKEARFARHLRHHQALKAGLGALGLSYAADPHHLLPPLNAVHIPEGVDDVTVRRQLLATLGLEIGGGLGVFKGRAWRIGIMGESCRLRHINLVLTGLHQCLIQAGRSNLSLDAALAAVAEVLPAT